MAGNKIYLEPILSEFLDPLNDNIRELIPIINAQVNDINVQPCLITDPDVIISEITKTRTGIITLNSTEYKKYYNPATEFSYIHFNSFCTGIISADIHCLITFVKGVDPLDYVGLYFADADDINTIILESFVKVPNDVTEGSTLEVIFNWEIPIKAGHTYKIDGVFFSNKTLTRDVRIEFYKIIDNPSILYFKHFDALENVPIIY